MALVRFFYKINPEDMDVNRFVKLQSELLWLMDMKLINLEIGK